MSTVVVELYEALRKAGVDETLARSAASAVVPANALGDLATKSDLNLLALKSDLLTLRTELKSDIMALRAELKSEIMGCRVEISEMKADLIKWNVGAMAIMTAIFAGIARLA